MTAFSALKTKYLGNERWKILKDFHYYHQDGTYTVPSGFTLDFDSVPRIPFAYAWLKGRAHKSAAVHDHAYAAQIGRKKADKLFLDAMKAEGVPRRHRWPLYWGVRSGGWFAYRRHNNGASQ